MLNASDPCEWITNESLSLAIDDLTRAGQIVETVYSFMPYTEGVIQCVLNIIVLASIVAILRRQDGNDEKLAFIFIANLAVSDLLQFIVQTLFVVLGKDVRESETALQICHLHVCLWTFCICNSLFSTILITMDRYVYITKCMKYPVLVTKERVILSIALSWTLSLVISSMPLLIRCKSDSRMYDGRCIYNHVVPTYFAAFIATMILTILFLVYVLYFNILVKYYKKRNRLLEARKRTGTVRMTSAFHEAASSKRCSVSSLVATTNMGPATVGIDHHGTSNSLLRDVKFGSKSSKDKFLVVKKLGKVADFIHAIHYVIFLILAFTLAWLPYLIVLSTDIVADWKRDYLRDCGLDSDSVRDFSVSNLNYSTQVHQHLQEAAMEDLLALVCDKGIDESHVCGLVHLALHSQRQNLMQKTAVIIGVLHSIVNPIIYAFWYPQFRHQVLGLCRLFHSK